MEVGAAGLAEIHELHVSLTIESGLSAPCEMQSGHCGRERLEVTALKYSSRGAPGGSYDEKDKCSSMSYQWNYHCWSNLRIEG